MESQMTWAGVAAGVSKVKAGQLPSVDAAQK